MLMRAIWLNVLQSKSTSRSITAKVKRHIPNVGESENAMLYEIREQTGKVPFKLFLKKKKGFKFKKSFYSLEDANWFIDSYLRRCCSICKQNDWLYKTRSTDGVHGRIRQMAMGLPAAGSTVICPECRSIHTVQYEDDGFPRDLRIVLSYNP